MPFEGCCVAVSNTKQLWLWLCTGLNSILYMDAVMCSFKTGNNGTLSDVQCMEHFLGALRSFSFCIQVPVLEALLMHITVPRPKTYTIQPGLLLARISF